MAVGGGRRCGAAGQGESRPTRAGAIKGAAGKRGVTSVLVVLVVVVVEMILTMAAGLWKRLRCPPPPPPPPPPPRFHARSGARFGKCFSSGTS